MTLIKNFKHNINSALTAKNYLGGFFFSHACKSGKTFLADPRKSEKMRKVRTSCLTKNSSYNTMTLIKNFKHNINFAPI